MVVDLRQSIKKDADLVEACIFPHLLSYSMMNIPKDKEGKEVSTGWLGILGDESVAPIINLERGRQVKLAKRIQDVGVKVLNESGPADSFKEVTLALSFSLLELIRMGRVLEVDSQYVTIAIKIIEEALEYEDWGDLSRAKDASRSILRELYENNCFKQDLREVVDNGTGIIT